MKNNLKMINNQRLAILLGVFFTIGLTGVSSLYALGPASVNLLSANNFTILAKSGISTTGTTLITGDIGVSPVAATFITGFGLSLSAESPYSTSPVVTGKIYAPGYANPTPVMMTTAIGDMETAYTEGAGRTNPTATELGAGNIGGLTLAPGLYKWGTSVIIPTDVTLFGSANDVWIFQIAQNLAISSSVKVLLSGGAQASNVFWIVAGQTTLETNSVFNGNILDQTAIVLNTGASLHGRALAQTAVTLDANSVTAPGFSSSAIPATPATPATPAIPTVTSAISATPSSPAIPANQNVTIKNSSSNSNNSSNVYDTGCWPGNRFSITTGYVCDSGITVDTGCVAGNKFSIMTGRNCASSSAIACTQEAKLCPDGSYIGRTGPNCQFAVCPSQNTSLLFGQQVKMIATNFAQGSRGIDIKTLQKFLIAQDIGNAARALAEVGTTSYFGDLTRAALVEFQKNVGISPALGNFGSATRAYINSH